MRVVLWTLPVAPDVVMPTADPIISPAPEESVKLPPPITLVPALSVAPLFTVKPIELPTEPPEVKPWVPAFLNTIEPPLFPLSTIDPAVSDQSPVRLSVEFALAPSATENVPPVIVKFTALSVIVVLLPEDIATVPPD